MDAQSLARRFRYFRYLSLIGVVSSGFGSAIMFLIGAVKTIKAWKAFVPEGLDVTDPGISHANTATALIAQGIDSFLIALVLMIFASGIYNIFIRESSHRNESSLGGFEVHDIGQLKRILAELVIIILFVKFLEISLNSKGAFEWSVLVLPLGTLALALSLKFIDLKKTH